MVDLPYGRYSYRVERTKVVDDQDLSVLETVKHDRLVLSACHPLYSAAERIIVFARPFARGPRDDAVVMRILLRIVYWLAVIAISVALLNALVLFFESRDSSDVSEGGAPPQPRAGAVARASRTASSTRSCCASVIPAKSGSVTARAA